MLFKQNALDGIANGDITVAFRRWGRANVKAGSRIHTTAGLIGITAIAVVPESDISEADWQSAGFSTREELFKELNSFSEEGAIYRIELRRIGADPREELREREDMTEQEAGDVLARLARLDKAGAAGHWTANFLCLIDKRPGVRAKELAEEIGWDTEKLKLNVRKLKNLGLTISLGTGYRISPRGKVVLNRIDSIASR